MIKSLNAGFIDVTPSPNSSRTLSQALSECPVELSSIDAGIQEGLSLEVVGALRHSTESVCGAARQIEQRSVATRSPVCRIKVDKSMPHRQTEVMTYRNSAVEYLFAAAWNVVC